MGCAQSRPLGEVTIEGGGRGHLRSHKLSFSLATERETRAQGGRQTFTTTFPSKSTIAIIVLHGTLGALYRVSLTGS